jgi:hypothetical protein
VAPLIRYGLGRLDLETAFRLGSQRLGLDARPVIMPFAEAAIDVDKPDDKALCEIILQSRTAIACNFRPPLSSGRRAAGETGGPYMGARSGDCWTCNGQAGP